MKIDIAADWRVNVIPMNFVLEERVESGVGPDGPAKEPYKWEVRGYYSSLRAALRSLPDHLAHQPGVETTQQYFARWDDLIDRLARSAGK